MENLKETLSDYERLQAKNARHRALIMQILRQFPNGLTVQQIVDKERYYYGYTFLTDNRLRELRKIGWVENIIRKGEPQLWKPKRSQLEEL